MSGTNDKLKTVVNFEQFKELKIVLITKYLKKYSINTFQESVRLFDLFVRKLYDV